MAHYDHETDVYIKANTPEHLDKHLQIILFCFPLKSPQNNSTMRLGWLTAGERLRKTDASWPGGIADPCLTLCFTLHKG